MNKLIVSFSTILFVGFAALLFGQEKPSKYWVFFKDKQVNQLSKKTEMMIAAKETISARALKRRAKVRSSANLIDDHDLPVAASYLQTLKNLGYQPLVISKWLNAASFRLSDTTVKEIANLPFVQEVRKVAVAADKPRPWEPQPVPPRLQKPGAHSLDYGASFTQNELSNVPAVHDLGITGEGVWIGMLDTGFKYSEHEAFENLRVIAEHDFISDDGVTENEDGEDVDGQHNHGTQTLSAVGAFKEGRLIGSAFGAEFVLAKTEFLLQEIPQEEDNWVAGIEWLENQGVDVVSSSLGYTTFPNENFYTPGDMDGKTAVTTRAANLAVRRGLVVVNSAGNEGDDPWRTIIAPSDADSVIAVGAVTASGSLSSFSSVGPTADGRTKPDVVAMGSSVFLASPSSSKLSSSYGFASGTSFSCPLTAGIVALMLSAHPNLTPYQVQEALRSTADRANNPDNQFGWGLVNAYQAVLFHGPVFSNSPAVSVNTNQEIAVSIKVASRFGVPPNGVTFNYTVSDDGFDQLIAMSLGQETNQYTVTLPALDTSVLQFYFSVIDSAGNAAQHPYYAPDNSFRFSDSELTIQPGDFFLRQNYPNPFNPTTTIVFNLPTDSEVTLTIFNVLGQETRKLIHGRFTAAGGHQVLWDGKNNSGEEAASGVYFYVLQTNDFKEMKKMVLVH